MCVCVRGNLPPDGLQGGQILPTLRFPAFVTCMYVPAVPSSEK